MVQKLLADRFRLALHLKREPLPCTADSCQGGPKLAPAVGDLDATADISFPCVGKLGARNATVADFAHSMQKNVLDRPIIDQPISQEPTTLVLRWFRTNFSFPKYELPRPPDSSNTDGADLFTAIQQQLGLRLTAMRAPPRSL